MAFIRQTQALVAYRSLRSNTEARRVDGNSSTKKWLIDILDTRYLCKGENGAEEKMTLASSRSLLSPLVVKPTTSPPPKMKRPKNAVAVASAILLLGSVCQRCSSFAPPPSIGIQRRVHQVVSSTAVDDSTEESKASSNSIEQKEFSYAAILKAIDESHYTEATQSCTYLGAEILTKHNNDYGVKSDDTHINLPYHSPSTPIMSDDAVRSLRLAAQRYFIEKKGDNRVEIDRVSLDDLLTSNESSDSAWKESLDDAMVKYIYPTIRSGWPHHDAFKESTQGSLPVLTVTSASVFASGGYPGAKAVMTTFERDAGLFMVHIDLGNDHNIDDDDDDDDVGSAVMGALYMELLVDESKMKSKLPIIGPLAPGQMVVHNHGAF
jgi:hypothetical protein